MVAPFLVTLGGTARVIHHQRQVGQIRVFAVPVIEAGENAEHFQVALQAHEFEIAIKRSMSGLTGKPARLARSQ